MSDRNFDDLAERFERKLYGNLRGQLRLQLVTEGLLSDCPRIGESRPLRVLDAGCGLGQMAGLLASRGHEVIACDVSEKLLQRARVRIAEDAPDALQRIRFVCCPLQEISTQIAGQFDLILFHAVLEWLESPRAGLQSLIHRLRPDGELSLLFYNRHAIVFKNLLRGDFRRIDRQDFRGDSGSLTPTNPLVPDEVDQWLQAEQLEAVSRRGIRTFYDYMNQVMDTSKPALSSPAEVLRMERQLSEKEPYRSLARYLLWHCRRAPAPPALKGE